MLRTDSNNVPINFTSKNQNSRLRNAIKAISILLISFCFLQQINAQTIEKETIAEKRWGAEFSPIGAGVFRLFQAKTTYLINPKSSFKGEVGLGMLLQPESNAKASEAFNEDGTYSAYMASIGYRQYLWKGLHLESVLNFGYAGNRNNKIDGQDYRAFIVFTQNFIGYKFNVLKRAKYNLFIIGQGGFGYVPINTNQWPRSGESSIYGLGDMKIGINF
ncbi:MAG: hypothetical protein ACFCUU_19625 [Cyclobacteriaceae bacterium]